MTAPRVPREGGPAVEIARIVRASGGVPVIARVIVTNHAPEPRVMLVTPMGVDATWLPTPQRMLAQPGFSVPVDILLTPAVGTLPARYPFAVAVQALDPVTDRLMSETTLVESELVVDAPGNVEIGLDPVDMRAVFGKKLTVTLHNAGLTPADVDLEVRRTDSIDVRLDLDRLLLQPAEQVRIRGKVKVTPARAFGHRERHLYTVTARSAGAPRHVQAAVSTRAIFGPGPARMGIWLAVIATWVGLALVFVPKLADSVRSKAISSLSVAPAPSSSPSSGAGGSSGSGSGSGGGSGGSSGGGSGSGSGSSSKKHGGGSAPSTVRLSGTMSGTTTSGVTVSMRPTDLLDPSVQSARGVGVSTQSLHAVAMVPEAAVAVNAPNNGGSERMMTTKSDGAWSFTGVHAPGYYLVEFRKAGFQTQRFVVDSSSLAAAQPLNVDLQPGQGKLSGTVLGPGGLVPGAQISITDGTSTITSSTNTKGAVGTWSVQGLTTPNTYLVSASKDGLGLESRIITLGGGGQGTVSLTLKNGVAALVGKVSGLSLSSGSEGLAGATVTATDGTITRSTTTITGSLAGEFRLPDLPVPAVYTVTIQAPGFATQTLRVPLVKGVSEHQLSSELASSAATVKGSATDSSGLPLVGVGLTLTSPANTYKITSTDTGDFSFTAVVPGTYVLSAQYEGLQTQYKTVIAVAGVVKSGFDFVLPPQSVTLTNASIVGYVGSAVSPNGTLCTDPSTCTITYTLTDSSGTQVPIDATPTEPSPNGPTRYTITASSAAQPLSPGEYQLLIGVTTTSTDNDTYLSASINVQVPLNQTAFAPQLNLFPADTISGTLTSSSSLEQDPNNAPASPPPYVNCVWAIPTNDTTTKPVGCPSAPLDETQCVKGGKATAAFVDIQSNGVYKITGLCDGTYNVTVVLTNPYFVAPKPDASIAVTHGSTQTFSATVSSLGDSVMTLYKNNGTVLVTSGTVDATCGGVPTTPAAQTPNAKGQVVVYGLPTGQSVTCQANLVDSNGNILGSGSVSGVVGVVGGDTNSIVFLSTPSIPAFGQLVRSDTNTAISGATVNINGTIAYNGTFPVSGTASLTTNADGCFAIVPKNFDVSTLDATNAPAACVAGGAAFTSANASPATDASGATQSFVSTAVTVSASATGYTTKTNQALTLQTSAATQLRLDPTPDAFTGTVTIGPSAQSGLLSSVSVIVQSKPTAAGLVTASVDTSGTIHVFDPNIGRSDVLWPGTYTMQISLSGFYAVSPASGVVTVTCNVGASCTSPSITLQQYGTISVNVTGYLTTATPPIDPSTTTAARQGVGTARVQLTQLTCTKSDCSDITPGMTTTTCPITAGGRAPVGTDSQGNANFSQLQWGAYSVTICAPGWQANVAPGASGVPPEGLVYTVIVGDHATNSNASTTPSVSAAMLVDPVDLNTKLTVGAAAYCSPTLPCNPASPPSVYLYNSDLSQVLATDTTPAADGSYVFPNLQPFSTYWVVVNDPTGAVLPAALQVTINLPSTQNASQLASVPVTLTSNTVVGGPVSGTATDGTAGPALTGIPVTLGTGSSLTNFVPIEGTDGKPLTTTTVAGGTFTFTTVPNGQYYALYNDPNVKDPTTGLPLADPTYQPQLSTSTVTVFGGFNTGHLAAQQLPRSVTNVTVKLVPDDSSDNISGATLTLTSTSTSTTLSSGAASPGGTGAQTWSFSAVPADQYTLTVVLPDNHYGAVAGTGSAPRTTCSVGSLTKDVSCTSVSFTTTNTDPAPVYDVHEYEANLSVSATALALDTGALPASVVLSATDSATTPNPVLSATYAASDFSLDNAVEVTPTASFWGRTGTTYQLTATPDATTAPNWTTATGTINAAGSSVLATSEIGATVTATVTYNKTAEAGFTVTLTPPSGIGDTTASTAQTDSKGVATFTGIPFGFANQWTASTSGSVTQGKTTVNVSATYMFTIDGSTCTMDACPIAAPLALS